MKQKKIRELSAIFVLAIIFFSYGAFVFSADLKYKLLAPLPLSGDGIGSCTGSSDTDCTVMVGMGGKLSGYINSMYRLAVASAAVLAVLMIVVGGFNYASTDAIGNKENGKSMIKSALGGLLLVFASWIIVNTINPQLLNISIVSDPLRKSDLSDLLVPMFLSQRAQENLNSLQNNIDLAIATTNRNVNELESKGSAAIAEIENMRGVVSAFESGELTDEEKMLYFGTTDDQAIQGDIDANIKPKIAAAEERAKPYMVAASIVRTSETAINSLKDREVLVAMAEVANGGVWMFNGRAYDQADFRNFASSARSTYLEAKEKLKNIEAVNASSANSTTINSEIEKIKNEAKKQITAICGKLVTQSGVTVGGFGQGTTPVWDNTGKEKCLADYQLKSGE